ncbi:MurR/RpiR family transcriptional regulator [Gynuella sunshinyii]|uniref:Transcriptional regulator n=1 Tax=Gynuella sunshinyii YC6258 TaxID=1445510 RepID=A0A0C5VDF5_9GAMM|nr:MurR/RpiR family transcriptional regulator [Gynuella sunshinyii]AJQ97365.1 transcriptional regulator [Gynuella sunshinyii YC6258]
MNQTNLPNTLEELEQTIAERYNDLSKRLQQVARYLTDHPRDVAFDTVASIATKANVTPSTLIRFANALGFQGFSEMQRLFRSKLIDDAPSYSERIRMARQEYGQSDNPSPFQLLQEFTTSNVIALDHLKHEMDEESLNKALDILENAKSTHIVGVRRAFVVASYFAYALRHIEHHAYLVDGIGGMFKEQAQSIDAKDAVIAISFTPYAQETLDVAQIAMKKGSPLIVITDSPLSPLALQASVSLVVKEAQVRSFRSLTSSLCLAQTLSIGLAYRLQANNKLDGKPIAAPDGA